MTVRTLGVRLWMAALSLAFVAAGCGGGVVAHGRVVQPARIPVRAFPRIVVTSEPTEASERLADQLAQHLSTGRSRVRRLDPGRAAALRREGRLRAATVVLHVGLHLTRRDRPEWRSREELTCGPGGCIEMRRPRIEDVPVILARLVLEVSDGPSGRSLQREELHEEESGMDALAMRLRVIDRLTTRARELVDQRGQQVAVALQPVEHPDARRALEHIRRGRWRQGRLRLEALVGSPEFESLEPTQRAHVWFDLGQARRFDVSIPAARRFSLAARALRAAMRLTPQPHVATALADLEAHRRSRAMVREQQEAMAHNFALQEEPSRPSAAPAPPPSYR